MKSADVNTAFSILNFSHPMFGNIRVITIDGEPWMVGKDVATILGYRETAKAIREHIDPEDKGVSEMDTPGGKQRIVIINESGLYSLAFGSKMKEAKIFKRWVTREVLPSIRKTGTYVIPDGLREKAINFDKFLQATNCVTVGEMAKILNKNGFDTGKARLNEWLRIRRLTMTDTNGDRVPTQSSIDDGILVLFNCVTSAGNAVKIGVTTEGQKYILKLFEEEFPDFRKVEKPKTRGRSRAPSAKTAAGQHVSSVFDDYPFDGPIKLIPKAGYTSMV